MRGYELTAVVKGNKQFRLVAVSPRNLYSSFGRLTQFFDPVVDYSKGLSIASYADDVVIIPVSKSNSLQVKSQNNQEGLRIISNVSASYTVS